MKKIALLCLLASCSACGMYTSKFDCPARKGIGCAPVSEVLELVVERENGEDLFVVDREEVRLLKEGQKKKRREKQGVSKKLYLLQEHEGKPVVVEATGVSP